jgi:hypothetical protein
MYCETMLANTVVGVLQFVLYDGQDGFVCIVYGACRTLHRILLQAGSSVFPHWETTQFIYWASNRVGYTM